MTANEIRQKFLDFFESKGHTIVESDSLVPKDDPTVLFTTAGMQQFKRQFLGQIDDYTRAASSQKCLRTDDLDKVGKTPYHHTFFEMLGNFSFGDYFKKEAIEWAWEFLTKELKLPADKLWASVYKDDNEADQIWKNLGKGFDPKRLIKLGDHDNFWPADAKEKGPNGPCGPCSEIFYDYGQNPECKKGKDCDPSCDCGRFSEIWNLVFTQFNRKDGGVLEPLPAKNIDTGMGLERLVAVVQGKKNNFETDLFEPILKAINTNVHDSKGNRLNSTETRIIADHVRAIVFGIADGVIPSNEGRGYVIRKLIVEISDLVALKLGIKRAIIFDLVPDVIKTMRAAYPEIAEKEVDISPLICGIEENYIETRSKKSPVFGNQAIKIYNSSIAPSEKYKKLGELMFRYKDTHGLNYSSMFFIIQHLLPKNYQNEERIIKASFDNLMNEQKDRSRAASKMTGDVFADADLDLNVPKTKFLGYEHNEGNAKVLKLFINNNAVEQVKKGDKVKVVLEQTPFYAEAGGQIGDTGFITKKGASMRIKDTQKIADIFIHSGVIENGNFKLNDTVEAAIDAERRFSIMRNHTATHLLQAALRKTLGSHVQQQGSLVAEDRLRFDFTHPQAVSEEQIAGISDVVNNWVNAGDRVQTKEMSLEEAKKSGALAFFAEKYGQKVRVVSIGNYSKEFCGGTHLKNTKEIQQFAITKEGSVAQGIRRLEAKTGQGVQEFLDEQAKETKTQRETLELKKSEARAQKSQLEEIKKEVLGEIEKNKEIPKLAYFTYTIKKADADLTALRYTADFIKQKISPVTVVLGSQSQGLGYVLASVPDSLTAYVDANSIIQKINPLIDGKGGGRPQMAQAGTKDPAKIDDALKTIRKYLEEKLEQRKL